MKVIFGLGSQIGRPPGGTSLGRKRPLSRTVDCLTAILLRLIHSDECHSAKCLGAKFTPPVLFKRNEALAKVKENP